LHRRPPFDLLIVLNPFFIHTENGADGREDPVEFYGDVLFDRLLVRLELGIKIRGLLLDDDGEQHDGDVQRECEVVDGIEGFHPEVLEPELRLLESEVFLYPPPRRIPIHHLCDVVLPGQRLVGDEDERVRIAVHARYDDPNGFPVAVQLAFAGRGLYQPFLRVHGHRDDDLAFERFGLVERLDPAVSEIQPSVIAHPDEEILPGVAHHLHGFDVVVSSVADEHPFFPMEMLANPPDAGVGHVVCGQIIEFERGMHLVEKGEGLLPPAAQPGYGRDLVAVLVFVRLPGVRRVPHVAHRLEGFAVWLNHVGVVDDEHLVPLPHMRQPDLYQVVALGGARRPHQALVDPLVHLLQRHVLVQRVGDVVEHDALAF